ncbi:MAG: uL15 family ribosomal protein [Candidatus Micrarchaeia archaeon]|jgi:large subunit ribosomal protein L15
MVVRHEKKNRKYHGTRSWGAGNIKNRRGAGDRGGVGRGGRKHKYTYLVVYEKESIGKKGFNPFKRRELKEIDLDQISKLASKSGEEKPSIELRGYKVLGDGALEKAVIVKADGFSKKAIEKIKSKGGEALLFE